MTASSAITGLQIITTAAIILVPVLTNHPINPFQRRANKALNRLRSRDDNIFELVDDLQSDDDFETMWEELGVDIAVFDGADQELDEILNIEAGYLQRGDPGFRILLDAIANNRSINKSEVTAIGLIRANRDSFFSIMETNEDMPESAGVPISPNAAIFVDYNGGALHNLELITHYPESPSLTLSLHELEIWLKEAIRRKSHYIVIVLTLIWTTSSLLSTIV